jgi:hypothetical protein
VGPARAGARARESAGFDGVTRSNGKSSEDRKKHSLETEKSWKRGAVKSSSPVTHGVIEEAAICVVDGLLETAGEGWHGSAELAGETGAH